MMCVEIQDVLQAQMIKQIEYFFILYKAIQSATATIPLIKHINITWETHLKLF